jgi:hypothetical protein
VLVVDVQSDEVSRSGMRYSNEATEFASMAPGAMLAKVVVCDSLVATDGFEAGLSISESDSGGQQSTLELKKRDCLTIFWK